MMDGWKTRGFALALCVGLALGGCGGGGDDAETVPVGALLSTTGSLAGLGQQFLEAATLAVEEINAAGGVLGHPLRLVLEDDASDATRAVTAAERLRDGGVGAVVGAIGSGSTLAAADVLEAAKVVQVSPSSTSPELTSYAHGAYLFRTCPSDALQGRLLAQRAVDAGVTKAAVVFVPNAYGQGLADAFEAAFTAGGGTVTDKVSYTEQQSSYTDLVGQIMDKAPEAIVLLAYPTDGAQFMRDFLTDHPGTDVRFYFGDAVANDDFVQIVGPTAFTFPHEGTVPAFAGPAYAHFEAAMEARYGRKPGAYESNIYDAVYLVALAMEASGAQGGDALRDSLAQVSAGGTAFEAEDFADAVAALARGEDIDYAGASGDVDFDAQGDVVGPYDIWQVKDGAITAVETSVAPR